MAISDWLTVTPDTGNSGQTTITVSASSLSELSNRAKAIRVTSGNLTEYVTVIQKTSGASLSISPGMLVLPDSGGTGTLSVICSGAWTISPMRSWIQFSASAGTGSTTITVTASSNTSKSDRGATFFISSGSLRDRTDIVQYKDASLTLFPTSFNLAPNANTQFIMVTPSMQGQTWQIQNYPDWVTSISPTSSTQEEVVTFSYGANTSTSARTGNISFLYRGIPQQVALTQSGEQTFEISPSAVTFPQSGGSSALTISSSTSWKIFYPSFVTGPENGSGSTAITITALPNTGLYKEGVITAQTNDGLISHTINCVLDGPVFVYSPTAITANWTGGSATVNITADTAWQIISYPNWATPSTTQGSGNGSVTFTFGVNEGTNSRTESVQFRCRNRVFSVNITQKPRDLIIIPTSVTFTTYSATSTTVNFISGYNWEATNVPSWVTLSQTAGTGNLYITISADANPAVDRTGSVVFTCNGQNYSFEIQQYGMERFGMYWDVARSDYGLLHLTEAPTPLYVSIDGATPVPYSNDLSGTTMRVFSSSIWDAACDYSPYVSPYTSLNIGSGVTEIGDSAFRDSLLSGYLVIPDNITSIGELAFAACPNIVSVTLPSTLTEIKGGTFSSCSGISNTVILPSGITKIGASAFDGCVNMKGITIPSGVTEIGDAAFEYCAGLEGTLVIPDSVTSIGRYAFKECSGISGLVLSSGLTEISESSFADCTGLLSVTIPENILYVRDNAFSGCTGMTGLTIEGLTNFANNSGQFYRCSSLNTINFLGKHPFGDSYLSSGFFNSASGTGVCSYYVGLDVKKYRNAFPSGWTFTPIQVTDGWWEFTADLEYWEGEPIGYYTRINTPSGDDILVSVNGGTPYLAEGGMVDGLVNERNTIRVYSYMLWDNPLQGSDKLTASYSLAIGPNVNYIGKTAGRYNDYSDYYSNPTSVTFTNDCNTTTIGASAFAGSGSVITAITIPNTVKTIEPNAFAYSKLVNVVIPDSVTILGDYDIPVYGGSGYVFNMCTGLTSVTIGSGVHNIPQYTFYNCYNLSRIYLNSMSVTEIGEDAFDSVASTGTFYYHSDTDISAFRSKLPNWTFTTY